ncbi:LysR family transcriptional regulator [Streptomyces sp. NPDC026672]|uniref:LysR family transcriptional regulator n=1 Tax=unclassified Streptomyces TaxID=2593676 RepID=UPI0033C0BA8D
MVIAEIARHQAAAPAVAHTGADLGLSRLRSFVCLAEELHFGRAAQRLHISQPALSQQIVRLEREVSASLLWRTNRSVWLTPAGREFLKGARAALHVLEETTHATRKLAHGRTPLVLSHVPHASADLGTFVEAFRSALKEQLFQTTAVRVARHNLEEHRHALQDGRAVLGIRPADGTADVCGLVSADITVSAAPEDGGDGGSHRLRLSWPEWASPAEVDRLLAVAQSLAPAHTGD